jgi:hypothetical protein
MPFNTKSPPGPLRVVLEYAYRALAISMIAAGTGNSEESRIMPRKVPAPRRLPESRKRERKHQCQEIFRHT